MTAPVLTPPQISALTFLATVPAATATQIATAVGGAKARGGARAFGRIGRRLVALDLAAVVPSERANIPAYRITSEGRACLPKFRVAWEGGATGPLARDIADALAATLSAGNGPHWVEAVDAHPQ